MKNPVSRSCPVARNIIFPFLFIVSRHIDAFSAWPFITDDVRVTPEHTFLTEASLRYDLHCFQNLMLFALGLTKHLELTVGFIGGYIHSPVDSCSDEPLDQLQNDHARQYSIYSPLLQVKYLIVEQKECIPAIGFTVDFTPPLGAGSTAFVPGQWNEFGFVCIAGVFLRVRKISTYTSISAARSVTTEPKKDPPP